MAAKTLNVIVGQLTTETMNKMVVQMAQMVAPIKTTARGGCHGSLPPVLNDADYSSITKGNITSTKPVTQQTSSIKASRQHQPCLKYSPSKKNPKSFKRNLTNRRQSPTLASNVSSTASKNSTSKNSTKSTLGTPTTSSKCTAPSLNQLVHGHDLGMH